MADKIPQARFGQETFHIVGEAPYVQARFAEKARQAMMNKMEEGPTAKTKKVRVARSFKEDYRQAMHIMKVKGEEKHGLPSSSFRNAMISACRLVGFKMTLAKLSVFVIPDGFDVVDGVPLTILHGEPEMLVMHARNQTGVTDIRVRPQWREWSADVQIRWDLDQFTQADVFRLLERAGAQVGLGEGRPDSRESNGLGWGLFRVDHENLKERA